MVALSEWWSRLAEFVLPLEYMFIRRSCSRMREDSQPWVPGMTFACTRPHRFARDHIGISLLRTEPFLSIAFWRDTHRQCVELGAGYGWTESVWQESYNVVHHDRRDYNETVRAHYNQVPDEIYIFMNLCLRAHAQSTEAPPAGHVTLQHDCVACLTLTAIPAEDNSLHGFMVLDDGTYAIIGALRCPEYQDDPVVAHSASLVLELRCRHVDSCVRVAFRIDAQIFGGCLRPVCGSLKFWRPVDAI